jgi:hypothetical protein
LHLNQSGEIVDALELDMVIEGTKHLAEVVKLQDLRVRHNMFRYSVQRQGSSHIIYWGHEASEDAAIQMAKKFLDLLDLSSETTSTKVGPKPQSLDLQEPLAKA